ncbi:hypothetical protein ES703_118120 [subsurface metagenome]
MSIPKVSHKASDPLNDLTASIYSLASNPPPQIITRVPVYFLLLKILQNSAILLELISLFLVNSKDPPIFITVFPFITFSFKISI